MHWAPYNGRVAACIGCVARCATHCVVAPRSRYKNCIATQSLLCALRAVSRALPCVLQCSCAISQGAATLYRNLAALYHSLAALYRETKGRPLVMIQKLYHDPLRSGRAHASHPYAQAGRVVAPCWPCHSATPPCLGAAAWPYCAPWRVPSCPVS